MSSMLNDPEIRNDFCDESEELLEQMQELLEEYEDEPEELKKLETFGQMIDRMMGTAKSMGLTTVGTYCELGKVIGYKSSQSDNLSLNALAAGVLLDTVEFLQAMIADVRAGDLNPKAKDADRFVGRLKILSEKFKHIKRASVEIEGQNDKEVSLEDIIAALS